MPLQPSSLSDPSGSGEGLAVLLHAFDGRAERMAHVARAVREIVPGCELFVPELPLKRVSFADPNAIVANLLDELDRRWQARRERTGDEGYRRIILIGHSTGSLLARKLYVVACGEKPKAPFEPVFKRRPGHEAGEKSDWAGAVERIVLLAGMNRGWQISHHLSLWKAITWSIGVFLASPALLVNKPPVILTMRRGATFITQLRIQWIRMRQAAEEAKKRGEPAPAGQALTVQLLGSVDDYVAPTDNVDLVSGGDFAYLDVPFSGHKNVVEMDGTHKGRARRAVFRQALTAGKEALEKRSLLPQDDPRLSEDFKKTSVVFVVHGIRDEGHWTHKVARKVLMRARAEGRLKEFATETSSYGYFPMLPFLFSWRRREKVEWLMDQYAEIVARYPEADLHYVGHSNGTYCLARALELYPCCRFERVVFAGSVVRSAFAWHRFMAGRSPQIGSVLNYVATADWVVAGFPRLFEFLRFGDLGGAGHNGFAEKDLLCLKGRFDEVRFVRGAHHAAIEEENWDAIAGYVYSGKAGQPNAGGQSRAIKAIGAFPPLAWAGATFGAILVGGIAGTAAYFAVRLALTHLSPAWLSVHLQFGKARAVALAAAVLAALAVIWKGVTKL